MADSGATMVVMWGVRALAIVLLGLPALLYAARMLIAVRSLFRGAIADRAWAPVPIIVNGFFVFLFVGGIWAIWQIPVANAAPARPTPSASPLGR